MKNIFFVTAFLLATLLHVSAQKQITEGKVTYAITLPDTGQIGLAAAMIGKEQVIFFKNGASRTESQTMLGKVVVVSNPSSNDNFLLMDMGEKTAVKMSEVDLAAFTEMGSGGGKPVVQLSKEQKKIQGYKCTKANVIYKIEGKDVKGEIWYTKDIAPVSAAGLSTKLDGIDGFMMETSLVAQGMLIKLICTKIETAKVGDDMFKIPEDYTIKTMQDLMGGMMK